MDIDAFVAAHQGTWFELQHLTARARRITNLGPDEVDRLVGVYEQVGSHLAHARVRYAGDDALIGRLTLLVGDAHGVLYGQPATNLRSALARFATVTFPMAIYSIRRFIVVAALLMLVPWAVFTIWFAVSPEAFDLAYDEAGTTYVERDFEDYYSSQPSQNFASQVFLNNIRVAFLAFAAGALLCVVTASLLIYNGINVGAAGGLFTNLGQWEKFWGLILPHGLLEISAVIVAGAAGLRIGWTVIDPGDRPRFEAFVDEARRSGTVVIGLVVAFLLAALVEGFVTGRPWSPAVRITIGVIVFSAFWATTIAFAARARRTTADPTP